MNGVFPKEIENMINDYAISNYEKIGLNGREFIYEFEEGHGMTDRWFTVYQIEVNSGDNFAIITMGSQGEDDEDDEDEQGRMIAYASYCFIEYTDKDWFFTADSGEQGGTSSLDLYQKYKRSQKWKSIYTTCDFERKIIKGGWFGEYEVLIT